MEILPVGLAAYHDLNGMINRRMQRGMSDCQEPILDGAGGTSEQPAPEGLAHWRWWEDHLGWTTVPTKGWFAFAWAQHGSLCKKWKGYSQNLFPAFFSSLISNIGCFSAPVACHTRAPWRLLLFIISPLGLPVPCFPFYKRRLFLGNFYLWAWSPSLFPLPLYSPYVLWFINESMGSLGTKRAKKKKDCYIPPIFPSPQALVINCQSIHRKLF